MCLMWQFHKFGIIKEPYRLWFIPIAMVPKPDCNLCFSNGSRKLNEVYTFYGNPMLHVEELIKWLGKAWFISTLDCTKGTNRSPRLYQHGRIQPSVSQWPLGPFIKRVWSTHHLPADDGYHSPITSHLCQCQPQWCCHPHRGLGGISHSSSECLVGVQ